MIIYEDRELEAMVLSGNSCIAVPFEIFVPTTGEAQITTYSCFGKIAETFEEKFNGDLLSADALNWLDRKIYADVKMFGYEHCLEDIHFMSEYSISDSAKLKKFDTSDVLIISSENELEQYDISLIDGLVINDESAVIIKDNKLVTIASANDVSFEDGSIELFVETDSDYRNKGYGATAVCALSERYLEKRISVRYKCAKNNHASIRLAEKCGFEKNGERYSYVCFAIGEDK